MFFKSFLTFGAFRKLPQEFKQLCQTTLTVCAYYKLESVTLVNKNAHMLTDSRQSLRPYSLRNRITLTLTSSTTTFHLKSVQLFLYSPTPPRLETEAQFKTVSTWSQGPCVIAQHSWKFNKTYLMALKFNNRFCHVGTCCIQ